jgi:hypothetical protein
MRSEEFDKTFQSTKQRSRTWPNKNWGGETKPEELEKNVSSRKQGLGILVKN